MVKIKIEAYDADADVFTISAFGFTPEDEIEDPIYAASAPDLDDFVVPGLVLPALIGEYGEPDELLGRTFVVCLP